VMPMFFDRINYHSFNRLINAWSFRRISSGPDKGSYFHELFLRGMPHLYKHMRRLCKKEKKIPMNPKQEPNFRKLSVERPLPELDDGTKPLSPEIESRSLQSEKNRLILEADFARSSQSVVNSLSSVNTNGKQIASDIDNSLVEPYRTMVDNEMPTQHVSKQPCAAELQMLMIQHRRNRFISKTLFNVLYENQQTAYDGIMTGPGYVPYTRDMLSTIKLNQLYLQAHLRYPLDQYASSVLPMNLEDSLPIGRIQGNDFESPKPRFARSG